MDIFTSKRLVFRPLIQNDKDMFVALFTDSNVMKYIGKTLDITTAISTFETAIKNNQKPSQQYNTWAIVDKESDQQLGICFFYRRKKYPIDGLTEVGLMVSPGFQRKSIGIESIKSLLNYGFTSKPFKTIHAVIFEQNYASIALFSKLGFSKTSPITDETHELTFVIHSPTGINE